MKTLKKILILNLLVLSSTCFAQKAMMRPIVFTDDSKSHNWTKIAKNRDWGRLSDQVWKVFADRDGVEVYSSPDTSNPKNKKLNFLEPVYISQIDGDYALVYKNLDSYDYTKLKDCIGWVHIDKLLLWETCLKTRNQTCEKAIILTNVSRDRGKTKVEEVHLYNSPTATKPNNSKVEELEFFFVYKYYGTNKALLAKTDRIDKSGQDARGWTAQFTPWNNRMCYEPNWGMKSKNYAVVFPDAESASEYAKTGRFKPEDKTQTVYYELPDKRWGLYVARLPILPSDSNAIKYRVHKIGTIASLNNGSIVKPETRNEYNEIKERIKEVNIVIVMDGTNSMQKHFKTMSRAIGRAMKEIEDAQKNTSIRFAAVIYRNKVDEKYGYPKHWKFTSAENIMKELNEYECGSKAPASVHYEAMFKGLDDAVNKIGGWDKKRSNFIILVGDAANKPKDSLNAQMIGEKLASKNINFVAFQANHPNFPDNKEYNIPYDDFDDQVFDIMNTIASTVYKNEKITESRFSYSEISRKREFKADSIMPLKLSSIDASIGLRGNQKFLEDLITNNIKSFMDIQEARMRAIENMIDSIRTGGEYNRAALIDYFDMSESAVADLEATGAIFITNGYASNISKGKEVFVSSVFLTGPELTTLIDKINVLTETKDNPRLDLQNALIYLSKVYIGETGLGITVNDLLKKIFDVQDLVEIFPANVTIEDITEESMVSDNQIEQFIDQVIQDADHLEEIKGKCEFKQNGLNYYYILLSDMPFQKH